MGINLTQLADEIERALLAGTLARHPQFADVVPGSLETVARATIESYRAQVRRDAA